ncbi:MAG: hypothetical protein ACE5JA_03320 [bacterium]
MKRMYSGITVLVALLAISGLSRAGEQFVFPVGIWVTEDLRRSGWPFDIPAEELVDLRSKGVEMILLNGRYSNLKWYQVAGRIWFDTVMVDVATLRQKLARADSFGFLVYADPKSIDETLKYWGHNPDFGLTPYFRYYDYERFTAATFRDTLDSLVSWVVDSLNVFLGQKNIQSLYRYIFWDEPFHHHVKWVRDTGHSEDDYWDNIWHHEDLTGFSTDSLGVGTLLKHKIEQKDTLHSVWFNLSGMKKYVEEDTNSYRGLCALQCSLETGTVPNPPHQFSFDVQVFGYNTPVGHANTFYTYWTSVIDSIVVAAKTVNPNNPPPVYTTQLQSWGSCNLDSTHKFRIAIPEEVKELINLAVLHEVKGIMHYVLWSAVEGGDLYAALWDDDLVPFDAPYEEFVYNREHEAFFDPDTLRPFCTNIPSESLYTDPFRDLATRPEDSTNYHKYLEDFYQWKYAPYARNYNALGEISNQLHTIGQELLNLWKTQSIAIIDPDSSGIVPPEIVTFSPVQSPDRYLFFVNKDFQHTEMGFTVKIARYDTLNGADFIVPVPPHLQSPYILDLSERHLIDRTLGPIYVSFHVTLGAGEGKLVRLMQGTEMADAMVADPDIEFRLVESNVPSEAPQYEFTEGDTIRLSAKVYNLGFVPIENLSVSFYRGHVNSGILMDTVMISLPPLTPGDTIPAVDTATIDWWTYHWHISPHNINVLLTPAEDMLEKAGNNQANMALVIHPEDYATGVVHDPWDMNERVVVEPGEPSTADIDSFKDFLETPDSISGVWEAKTVTGLPKAYLHVTDPIDGSKHNQLVIRFYNVMAATGGGYLKVGWLNTDMTSGADSAWYDYNEWSVNDFDFSENPDWKDKQIAALWVRPSPLANQLFKLAWVKLTTEP